MFSFFLFFLFPLSHSLFLFSSSCSFFFLVLLAFSSLQTPNRYECSDRGTLLATLLDCCHSAGNGRVCVNAAVGGGGAGLRFIPRDAISEEALETSFLKRIAAAFKGEQAIASRQERSGSQAGDVAAGDSEKTTAAAAPTGPVNDPSLPYQTGVEAVARELNANVSFQGLAAKTTKSNNLFPAMIAIITNLDKISNSKTPVPAGVTVTFLQALKRMVGTNVGYRGWAKLPVGKDTDKMAFATKLVQCLTNCLRASDSGVVYWTLEILYALCGPRGTTLEDRNEEEESQNKAMVLTERIINLLMKLLDAGML